MCGNSSPLGTNVTIPGHLSHSCPLTCEGTPSINLGIMKVISTWISIILTWYYHIGSQRRGVPTQVRVGRPDSEGKVGGAGPNWMKMWSSPGRKTMASVGSSSMPSGSCAYLLSISYLVQPSRSWKCWRCVCVCFLQDTIIFLGGCIP